MMKCFKKLFSSKNFRKIFFRRDETLEEIIAEHELLDFLLSRMKKKVEDYVWFEDDKTLD